MADVKVATAQTGALRERVINEVMARVYLTMGEGLLITAIVAMFVALSESVVGWLYGSPFVYMGLFLVQIFLVMGISAGIDSMSPALARSMFYVYSALMGLTLSVVFLVHDLGTVGLAFGVAAATFTAMSVVGLTTKKDLTSAGPLLLAGLFGLIIASIANAFLQSDAMGWLVSIVGVGIFMGLTAYDSQKIKEAATEVLDDPDGQAAGRIRVVGALMLYLDIINIFLFILSLMGEDE